MRLLTDLPRALRLASVAMLPVIALGVAAVRAAPPTLSTPAGGGDATTALGTAATRLETALAKGGPGIEFRVVSRSTLYAKPGGPRIEIPDPADPRTVASLADEYYIGASIASGLASASGFWTQLRQGPSSPTASADFVGAPATLASLVRGGVTWRNDGAGWYETDVPPAIGLDPATIESLPRFLRTAAGATVAGSITSAGTSLTRVTATGVIADAPGLIAVDLGPASVLVTPVELGLDAAGRLALIHARVRNTNERTFDLIVDVTIEIDYPASAPPLPDPLPTIDPAALTSEPVR